MENLIENKLDFTYLISIYEKMLLANNEYETVVTMKKLTEIDDMFFNKRVMNKLIETKLCKQRKCKLFAIERL